VPGVGALPFGNYAGGGYGAPYPGIPFHGGFHHHGRHGFRHRF
jgi:hypothetical protein